MNYDFDSILDRRGTHALAIDGLGMPGGFAPAAPREGFDAIPMWVADMNFAVPSSITDAIIRRAQHPAFGYYITPQEYYDAIARWHQARKGVDDLDREFIGYENGVLGGVASAIAAFSAPGDKVLLHSPTYIGFTGTINRMGRQIVHSPLVRDEDGVWRMDYEDMERHLRDENIHVAVFCSPHNPCGRVWEPDELERAMALFQKYECVVISDEIWSDLVMPGHKHLATQQVSAWAHDNVVAMYAPSKTFNLAGLVGSYHVVYNRRLRDRMAAVSESTHYNQMNVLSMEALLGAYTKEGSEWLDQLLVVLQRNRNHFCDFVNSVEGVRAFKPEGTYMVFVDCVGWLQAHGQTLQQLERSCWDVGVAVQDGAMFNGPTSLRVNLALPTSCVDEAIARLHKYVFA